jgi:outer membrane protein assembly factor BamD (BamD/ComL family)
VAADASFRRAYCLYRVARDYPRDEESCARALSALAAFLRDYPDEPGAGIAREYLEEMKERHARMYYRQAVFYDQGGQRPQAALIAYRNFVRRFPTSDLAEEAKQRIEILEAQLESAHE